MESQIRLFVIDVDGTMTDSGIYYDENGNELKKFSTRDAAGFFAAKRAGIETMILTGRECAATTRRLKELKADHVYQGIRSKAGFLKDYMEEHGYSREEVGYIGDDVNDLPAMRLVGFIGCPADSCAEIKEIADYISPVRGGYGAVRDVIERVLRISGRWREIMEHLFDAGI